MSREDPQFKLRMPLELREKAEQAAKAAGRSLNSEIVARVEMSFLGSSQTQSLLPASRARELSDIARAGIPAEVRRRTFASIARAVELGHNTASVDLQDLGLEGGVGDEDLERISKEIESELVTAGYSVEWDGVDWIWVKF